MRAAALFTGVCLAIWAVAGVAAYTLDRPHGSVAAGVVVIAAGAYELTPVTRRFRLRCRQNASSVDHSGAHATTSVTTGNEEIRQ